MAHYETIRNELTRIKAEIDVITILIRDSDKRGYLAQSLSILNMKYEAGMKCLTS